MAADHIRYDILAQEALRGVVRNVLADAAKNGPARRASFLHHVRHHAPRRAAVRPAARAISGRDDDRPAAPVLGSEGDRGGLRGRPVVRRRAGAAGRAVRRDQGLLRSVGAVQPAVRDAGGGAGRGRRARPSAKPRPNAGRSRPSGRRRAPEPGRASVPASPQPRRGRCRRIVRAEPRQARPTRAAPKWCGSTASARSDGRVREHAAKRAAKARRPAPRPTPSARSKCRPTATGARRPSARSRISASATSACRGR